MQIFASHSIWWYNMEEKIVESRKLHLNKHNHPLSYTLLVAPLCWLRQDQIVYEKDTSKNEKE